MDREALKPFEAAALIGVGRKKMRELLAAGELKAVRLGPRSTRIPVAVLRAWLARRAK